mgnify:CR=1 FL=1
MDETPTKTILCVEDEPEMIDLIRLILSRKGYSVKGASGGVEGIRLIKELHPDLVLLDLMMPDMDGYEVTRRLRKNPATAAIPILMFTAKTQLDDKVAGFEVGADDYLTKPFNLEELLLRVNNLIKKSEQLSTKQPLPEIYEFGKNKIDFKALECYNKTGEKITLTKKEGMLLKLLIENKNEVVTREKILQTVWGYNVYPTTRTIDNFILNFRKYFESDSRNPVHFHSVRGVGYKFTDA